MSRTPVIRMASHRPDAAAIRRAANVLRAGGLAAFPTETVYGIGADAMNPDAIRRVYRVKGRAPAKPLLVLIGDAAWLSRLTGAISPPVQRLIDAYWPGPLTLTFPAAPAVPRALLGGGDTIGVRLPGRSIALALVRAVGGPITAPSANRSGAPDPVSADEVVAGLDDALDLILDGGPAPDAMPSTVLDVCAAPPVLIRPGRVAYAAILDVWRSHAG